jgi:hypothetical protein
VRRGRVGLYDRHNEARRERLDAMTPEQRQLARAAEKAKALVPVGCAPVSRDPEAIDWEYHECGYEPRTKPDGKPLPKSGPNAEPAWRWTEEKGTSGRPCLRAAVKDLALKVYKIGYRHNLIELHQEGGFPDDQYWGPGGLIVRELKAMKPDWKRGQKQHLLSLSEVPGLDVAVWFPCCLLSGRIDEEMARVAGCEPKGTYARSRRGQPNPKLTWEAIANGALDR